MKPTWRKALSSVAVVSAFVLTTGFGFGKKAEAPPTYTPGQVPRARPATFVAPGKAASYMTDVKKIAITSCNVMFAFKSNGSAGTQGGLFSQAGGVTRAEAKVKVEYNLQGMDDTSMQSPHRRALCQCGETRHVLPALRLCLPPNWPPTKTSRACTGMPDRSHSNTRPREKAPAPGMWSTHRPARGVRPALYRYVCRTGCSHEGRQGRVARPV